jgi:hypothetical protein
LYTRATNNLPAESIATTGASVLEANDGKPATDHDTPSADRTIAHPASNLTVVTQNVPARDTTPDHSCTPVSTLVTVGGAESSVDDRLPTTDCDCNAA